ncbi:MAG: hypothetical protein KDD92_05190 [Caldilineaceae bacterium]|nr:hypothetical protein [Caldilineaceae bacterium]
MTDRSAPRQATTLPGISTLVLIVLVFAHLQILGLAESAALPTRVQDVLRHPLLGSLLPPGGYAAMGEIGPRPGDPIGLILNAVTLGALLLYVIADLALSGRLRKRLRWTLLIVILIAAVVLPAAKLILLRDQSGPASYAHDGGVIQTEATVDYFLNGLNPYVEDYVETPMAEWGFSEYRTALYHYPYLPWTFVSSAPFYLMGQALGFYDERLLYLLLWAIALALAPRLVQGIEAKLALTALLGLNPIMALDLIFGQNDVFVLSWILFSLVAWQAWRAQGRTALLVLSSLLFGLACASKPTAWFMAPFYGLLLIADQPAPARATPTALLRRVPIIVKRALPALGVFVLLLAPYIVWDAAAFYDDVWKWSSGQGETGYQIWGWGFSNFVLGLGWVESRFALWPFWLTEVVVAVPLLLWFLQRQQRENTLANACLHYGIFLFAFFYASRFLNENYLGYILAFLSLGILAGYASVITPADYSSATEGRSRRN